MLDATDCNKAQQVAAKYLSVRPGKRLQQEQRTALLEEAAATVGRKRKQGSRVDADGFEFQRKQHQTEVRQSDSLPPGGLTAPAPLEISNKFQALQSMIEDVTAQTEPETEAVQPEVRRDDPKRREPSLTSSSIEEVVAPSETAETAVLPDLPENQTRARSDEQPSAKRPCTKSTPPPPPPLPRRSSLNQAFIHYGAKKEHWSLTPRASTSYLWIGDSNSKQIVGIAADWEVHAFCGARLNHVADMLERMKKPSQPTELEAIVVAVGINHRDDMEIKLDKDLERIKTAVARMDDVKVYFVLPSYADNLDAQQKLIIVRIQTAMKKAGVCVAPLDPTKVFILPTDRFRIHYDSKTSNKIFSGAVSDVIQWQRNIDSVF
jgi:hypothetical protein